MSPRLSHIPCYGPTHVVDEPDGMVKVPLPDQRQQKINIPENRGGIMIELAYIGTFPIQQFRYIQSVIPALL